MAHVTKRNPDRCPTHPGALLREDVIPATGKTKAEIAQLLGISRQHLYDILRERKPVRSLGAHAGSLRHMARGTRRGCERNPHAPPESRMSIASRCRRWSAYLAGAGGLPATMSCK